MKLRKLPPHSYIYCALFTIIAVVVGTLSPILSLGGFLIGVISVFLLSDDDIVCYFLLILPFANIFKTNPSSSSLFTYLILLLGLVKLKKILPYGKIVLLSIGMLFFTIMVQIANDSLSITGTIKFVSYILLITYCIACYGFYNEYAKLFKSFIWGIFLSSVIAYLGSPYFNFSSYLIEKSLGYSYGFGYIGRFSALDSDPNYYSINLIVALLLAVILYVKQDSGLVKTLIYFLMITPFIILTFSKSALLMFVFPVLLLLYVNFKGKRMAPFIIIIPVLLIAAYVAISNSSQAKDIILARFSSGGARDLNSLTTGRSNIWAIYFDYMLEKPYRIIFGSGIGAKWVEGHAAHNTYVEALYHIGITGCILLLSAYRYILRVIKSCSKKNIFNYSVLICLILMYFFLSELFYFDSPFQLMLAFVVLKMDLSFKREATNEVFDYSTNI